MAIKELAPSLVGDPAFLEGFREEARIMALLDHPNCVKVFDFIETGGRAFLVSEYVDGASLRKIIQTSGALSPQQALGVLKGALGGLGHAHSLGLTHRDVKPENILADKDGVSKLADFGQAVFAHGPGAAGALTGSPPYMSPEQARGAVCDARSDLYSAGCILYEFLTGRPPFIADNAMAVMRMQVNDLPQDPRQYNPALPAEASTMLARALAKDPAQRFQSAAEMHGALEAAAVAGYGRDWERSAAIKGLVAGAVAVCRRRRCSCGRRGGGGRRNRRDRGRGRWCLRWCDRGGSGRWRGRDCGGGGICGPDQRYLRPQPGRQRQRRGQRRGHK